VKHLFDATSALQMYLLVSIVQYSQETFAPISARHTPTEPMKRRSFVESGQAKNSI